MRDGDEYDDDRAVPVESRGSMTRDYIECIQSQQLPWQPAPPQFGGAEWKRLSHDPENGACTALLRWRPGRAALPPALRSMPRA